MAVATGKRPKVGSVQKQAVSQVSTFLQDLPEKPKETFSLREAVDQLRREIQSALAKGYSYEDVAVILTQKGVEISPSTLKNYVPSGRRQAAKDAEAAPKPRGRRPRKTQSDESVAAPQSSTTTPAEEAALAAPKRGRGRAKATATVEAPAADAPPKRGRGRAKSAAAVKETSQRQTKVDAASEEKPAGRSRRKTAGEKSSTASKSTPRATRGRKKSS